MVYLLDIHGIFFCAFFNLFSGGIVNFLLFNIRRTKTLNKNLRSVKQKLRKLGK